MEILVANCESSRPAPPRGLMHPFLSREHGYGPWLFAALDKALHGDLGLSPSLAAPPGPGYNGRAQWLGECGMALNVAVQMDPIEKINVASDSTFALLLEASARGHQLFYFTPDRLSLRGSRVMAEAAPLQVRDIPGSHFSVGTRKVMELETLDVVLLRQDPPFDIAYITSTHLLEHVGPKVLIVNDPASVRNAPEKLFVMNFPQLMPPTLITRSKEAIEAFLDEHVEAVMKPLHGHGGAAVFKIGRRDPNFGARRRGRGSRINFARARDLRNHWPGAQAARPSLRRHRRHRWLSHRDQCDIPDWDPVDQAAWRSRSCLPDLECYRSQIGRRPCLCRGTSSAAFRSQRRSAAQNGFLRQSS